jgi:hypothetical protein
MDTTSKSDVVPAASNALKTDSNGASKLPAGIEMSAQRCLKCDALSSQVLTFYNLYLSREEELRILRLSQVECMSMAEDIQNLHVCVEEQRLHLVKLANQRNMKVDSGVGLHILLNELSRKQRAQLETINSSCFAKLKDQGDELTKSREIAATLQSEYTQLMASFQLLTINSHVIATELDQTRKHLDTYIAKTTENESVVQFLQHSNVVLQNEAARYLRCVDEQRRHMRLMNECVLEASQSKIPRTKNEVDFELKFEDLTPNNLPASVELFNTNDCVLKQQQHQRTITQHYIGGVNQPKHQSKNDGAPVSTVNAALSNVLVSSPGYSLVGTCATTRYDVDVGIHALITQTKQAEFAFYKQKLEQLNLHLQNEYIEQLAKMQHVIKAQLLHTLRIPGQEQHLVLSVDHDLKTDGTSSSATCTFQTPYKIMRSLQKQIRQQQQVITTLQQDNETLQVKLAQSENHAVLTHLDQKPTATENALVSVPDFKTVTDKKCPECAKTLARLQSYETLLFPATYEPESDSRCDVDTVSTLLAKVFERTKQRHTKVVWVYASIVSALHANTIMLIKDKEQNTQKRLKVLNGLVTTLSEKTEMLKIRETFISTLQRVNRDVLQSRDALQAKLVGVVLAKQTADALAQATTKKLELITAKNAQLVTFTATLKTMLGKLPQL